MPSPLHAAFALAVAAAPAVDVAPSSRFAIAPYLQDVRADSVVVAFVTEAPSVALVHYDGPSGKGAVVSGPTQTHKVRLSGLATGARYRYSVSVRRQGDLTGVESVSEPAEFTTMAPGLPFLFLVYGDCRDRDADHQAVVRAMLRERPDLLVQTGDMISRGSDTSQWRRYFAAVGPLIRSVPMYPALGNHELRGDPEASQFFRYFVIPGERKRRPVYYSFRYGNSLFVSLDGNSPTDHDQELWLNRTLDEAKRDPSIRHTFAFVHQPPYSVGAYCGSDRLQRRLVPILRRYNVRAVFAGHEHAYQHLERGGLRYFVSGGGGAPLYTRSTSCNFEDDMALRLFRAEHHYLRVQVDGDAATLIAISQHGEVLERVLLHEPVVPDDDYRAAPPTLAAATSPPVGSPPLPASSQPGRFRPSALLFLLLVSAMAMIVGLLLLTAPRARRRDDLMPHARRKVRRS
ncbi:MAG: metallophosphoesterase family protein [Myxococcales bacterium]|nr:metallophosphoesterase family protein [Myxococcales bacterium]